MDARFGEVKPTVIDILQRDSFSRNKIFGDIIILLEFIQILSLSFWSQGTRSELSAQDWL